MRAIEFDALLSEVIAFLQEQKRVSYRGLKRRFDVDDDSLEDIKDELIFARRVARDEDNKVLVWIESDLSSPSPHKFAGSEFGRAEGDPQGGRQDGGHKPSPGGRGSKNTSPLPPGEGPGVRAIENYTPKHLADKILASRSAMEGEKKQVTVLFCDVAGSMDLAEALGPEAWHNTLNEFFKILTSAIHEFEGTVNQYTGDGIMALFGAPIAAEDHARRACLAALAIQESLSTLRNKIETEHGEQFAARIGINTGEVVVGKIGDDLRMDYTAQGQVVGIAARLEALAEADSTLISDYTRKQVAGFFDLDAQGEQPIKGLKQSLAVFRLGTSQAETTRFDVSRRQGLTQFIGRQADMATLEAALQQAKAGNGQVVGVVAEAGTGKSRLCYEFLETCKARGMTVLQGHALSHGKNIPFMPMLQVFRAYYGITDDDDDRTAREKIAGRLVLLDEKFRDYLPVQFEFFGIADPGEPPLQIAPEAKQRQLISVMRQIVQGADPNIGNIIAYIEDLHWLDDGSEGFLEEWVDALAGTNSFLLVNFRPEYRAGWMQKTYYRQLPLAPLSPDEVREMLTALLGPEPSVSGLAELIFQRTGGNPFFCEEVVKSLQESGALQGRSGQYMLTDNTAELDIPQSVQAVLAARIDRLSDDEKGLLQTAAIIGRVFSRVLLAEVSDLTDAQLNRSLAALKAGEFIFQRSHGLGEEYIFKHALTQEVALGSQLSDKLKATHARVALALEGLNQDKLDDSAPLIAYHWEQAGEALTAAQWYMRAADHIMPTDHKQGMRLTQSTLRLTEDIPVSEDRNACRLLALSALLNRGSWRINIGREALEQYYEEAQQLLKESDDASLAMQTESGYAVSLGMSHGDIETWGRLIDTIVEKFSESLDYSEGINRERYLPTRSANQGYSYYNRGLLALSQEAYRDGYAGAGDDYEIGRLSAGFSVLGQVMSNEPLVRGLRGNLQASISDLITAHEQLKDKGFVEERLWTAGSLAHLSSVAGSVLAADSSLAPLFSEAQQVAEEESSDYSRIYLGVTINHFKLRKDNAPDIVAAYDYLIAECRERHAARNEEAQMLACQAEAYLMAGHTADAVRTAREGVALARKQTARLFELKTQLALIKALLEQGDAFDEIGQALDRCDALLKETDAQALAPQVIEQRGRLAAALGDADTARTELETAHKLYVEVGADGHAERLAAELGIGSTEHATA